MSLGEGSTPLVLAERLSERAGAEVWLKIEGANPTGSFKDRGMTCAVSAAVREGAEALVCASTGNTAASAAAYAARGGLDGRGDRARGQDRHGQARPGADARRARDRAARQLRPGADAGARAGPAAPDRARELGQPVPPGGPEDRRVRAPRRARGARRAVHPGRQRRQRHRLLEGLRRSAASRPRMLGFQAEGAAPLVHGAPVEAPETVASAIRIGNPARWEEALDAFTSSRGAGARRLATRRSSTPTASSPARRASSASPRRPPASPACSPTAPRAPSGSPAC